MTGHGGNLSAASRRTGIPEHKFLDFSASINPLGVPKEAVRVMKKAIGRLPHYPDPYAEGLASRLSEWIGAGNAEIVCGNGSTELIYLIPRALRPGKVLVTAPSFSEYEKACRNSGAGVVYYPLKDRANFDVARDGFIDALSGRREGTRGACSMAFLCNPNNPTGRLLPGEDVLAIARAARALKCYLVVDEAFIDFCPDQSVALEVESNPYLIVLRSMTKFFALAGLRIGYALFHPSLHDTIRAYKEPWTINTLAQQAGLAVLEDIPYQQASVEAMAQEKAFMEEGLRALGIDFIPSAANYYLLRVKDGARVTGLLEQRGILVRDCSNFPGLDHTFLRVAVRSRRENRRLLKEIGKVCGRL